ncbi:hypothetical protein GWK47_022325 [Chionoecetes opilio]|uniref:Uncharacterized protein n=1 Tax=Chionoecetes opilio TaxID=41210 RepID=A0A8J4XNN3_CHIOP|nr:hypothetical protein GWK47_022325 [Chionoecetes opilio]
MGQRDEERYAPPMTQPPPRHGDEGGMLGPSSRGKRLHGTRSPGSWGMVANDGGRTKGRALPSASTKERRHLSAKGTLPFYTCDEKHPRLVSLGPRGVQSSRTFFAGHQGRDSMLAGRGSHMARV